MKSVFLCDDEPIWLERMQKAVSAYQIKSDWEIEITYQSTSPENFLNFLEEHTPEEGIYFLDIDFKTTLSGFDLAKQIREIDPLATIIFITTHDEMVMETFRLKLEVLDYIIKDGAPLTEQIQQCLEHIEKKLQEKANSLSASITIRVAGSFYTIPADDIYYVESIKNTHKVCIHLQSTLYHFPDSLSSMRERLGDDFVQCHKTCLVNIRHIKELKTSTHQVLLDNGECCFGSVREWKNLVQKHREKR